MPEQSAEGGKTYNFETFHQINEILSELYATEQISTPFQVDVTHLLMDAILSSPLTKEEQMVVIEKLGLSDADPEEEGK